MHILGVAQDDNIPLELRAATGGLQTVEKEKTMKKGFIRSLPALYSIVTALFTLLTLFLTFRC